MSLPDLTNDPRWAIPVGETTAFFSVDTSKNKQFMIDDLAASGLKPEQVRAHVADIMPLTKGAAGGYYLPYFDLDGRVLRKGDGLTMYRIRQRDSSTRYTQPSAGDLNEYGLLPCIPYVLPCVGERLSRADRPVLHICEGEKKAAALMNVLDVAAIGIGGCWNWGLKKKIHPWIRELISRYGVQEVVVVPDGDIKRYDICTAYGTLCSELGRVGVEASVVVLPDPEDKIDDLLVAWGPEAEGHWESLGKLLPSSLVVNQSVLAEQYGLSTAGRDQKLVVNDVNVVTLLEMHPTFDHFWLNIDTNTYMMGDSHIEWEETDKQICTYMQRFFQMHNLKPNMVAESIKFVARQNKRSPFREWVDEAHWDGVERLADWPIRLWGCEDTLMSREVGTKFFVGMYARMANPGCKMDWMLVTTGKQGIGKSWFAELVSKGHSLTFMASGNARDDAAKMHNGLVVCIDELDAFNKREMTYWKTMISTNVDTYREPYGRGEVTMPRSSVLYGTSNHRTFLRHDATGQRRFGVLEPTRMLAHEDFLGELQQLWAEAKARYEEGSVEYWALSSEVQAQVQEEFQGDDPLQEQVESFLVDYMGDRFRMTQLLEWLDLRDNVRNRHFTGQLKDMLVGMGCVYKKPLRTGDGKVGPGYIIDRERWPRKNEGS